MVSPFLVVKFVSIITSSNCSLILLYSFNVVLKIMTLSSLFAGTLASVKDSTHQHINKRPLYSLTFSITSIIINSVFASHTLMSLKLVKSRLLHEQIFRHNIKILETSLLTFLSKLKDVYSNADLMFSVQILGIPGLDFTAYDRQVF